MRRVTKLFVVALLVGALAVPVVAWSHGWGRGHHMMGPRGSAPEYCWGYERGYGDVTKEQRNQLEELDRKFYDETTNLRNEIWAKSTELDSLLRSPDPDPEKVKAFQRELSDLRAKVDEKRLSPMNLRHGRSFPSYDPVKGMAWATATTWEAMVIIGTTAAGDNHIARG